VKRAMLNIPVHLVLFSLLVLLLLPNTVTAEGDGGWTTTASPGYIFQIEEDLYNNQKHLVMTVLKPDLAGAEIYWGPASGSVGSTYLLKPLNAESDMIATWQFNSVTEATVTVESCSTNCLWQSGQVVTLNKFFGDKEVVGNTDPPCFDNTNRYVDCGNGTVHDTVTNLIWLKNVVCFVPLMYAQANNVVAGIGNGDCGLTDGSYPGDWRLPTKEEWETTVERAVALSCTEPGLTNTSGTVCYGSGSKIFTGVSFLGYWSSTASAIHPDKAWSVLMKSGTVAVLSKSEYFYAWPVRSGN